LILITIAVLRQLLYEPFTPYFTLFTSIITNPKSPTCFNDLQLLRKVVLYFLQMHNSHQSARKLEKVAETFTRLAEAYVRHSMATSTPETNPIYREMDVWNGYGAISAERIDGRGEGANTVGNPLLTCAIGSESGTGSASMTPSLKGSAETDFAFGELSADPATLLNFFSTGGETIPSTLSGTSDLGENAGVEVPGSDPLMRELHNFGQSSGLDGTFDWFSWEQYNNSAT
jgi:hypothetical protein